MQCGGCGGGRGELLAGGSLRDGVERWYDTTPVRLRLSGISRTGRLS